MSDLEDAAAALRGVSARLVRRLRSEAGQADVTPSQVEVIRRLHEGGPATTADLARAEGMRPQSMAAKLAPLEAAGIIARRPDPADGRAVQLYLTDDGLRGILAGRDAKQHWLAEAMRARLTDAEIRTIADAAALVERLLAP